MTSIVIDSRTVIYIEFGSEITDEKYYSGTGYFTASTDVKKITLHLALASRYPNIDSRYSIIIIREGINDASLLNNNGHTTNKSRREAIPSKDGFNALRIFCKESGIELQDIEKIAKA